MWLSQILLTRHFRQTTRSMLKQRFQPAMLIQLIRRNLCCHDELHTVIIQRIGIEDIDAPS